MDHHISDEQLDRAVTRVLAERGDEIEASGITPDRAAARVRMQRTGTVPLRLVWVVLLALLAVAMLAAAWAVVGQKPSSPLTFAPGSIAFARGGDLYVAEPDGSDERLLDHVDPVAEGSIGAIALAPGGGSVAFRRDGEATSTIVITSSTGSRLGTVTPGGAFDWAPDGQRLAIMSGDLMPSGIEIVGLDGHREATLAIPDGFAREVSGGDTGPLWSPDGRWLAVAGCPTTSGPTNPPTACSTKTNTSTLLVAADGTDYRWLTDGNDYSMAWSSDSRLAIGHFGPDAMDVLSTDGTILREVPLPVGPEHLVWSPDATRLAVLTGTPRMVVVSVDGTSTDVPMPLTEAIDDLRWTADGQKLLLSSRGGTLWSVDSSGGTPQRVLDDVGPFDIAGPLP